MDRGCTREEQGGGGEGSSSAVEVTEKEILESGTWSGRRLEGGCNPRARWPVPKQRRWRRRGGLEVEVGLGAWWLVDGTLRWGGLPAGRPQGGRGPAGVHSSLALTSGPTEAAHDLFLAHTGAVALHSIRLAVVGG